MQRPRTSSTKQMITGYTLSILLVPLYVNMFSLWKILNSTLPQVVMLLLPICLTLLLLGGCTVYLCKAQSRKNPAISTMPLIAGAIVCLGALAIPDPHFPVKRIHVAEYMLLALLVRYAMSPRLDRLTLLYFSAGLTCLLGIHDEFLQGLHPARTYGLRDMSVNIISACGGALIWHGLDFFSHQNERKGKEMFTTIDTIYYFSLALSTLALVIPMMAYKGYSMPVWPTILLFASLVFLCSYWENFKRSSQHGLIAVSIGAFSLVIYPFIPRILPYSFF